MLTAPSTAGTYYYGACVDSVSGESNTGNNCSSGVAVAVGTPPAPDLVVGSPSVDDSSPTTGASFTLSATVRNQGSGSSAATTLRYYRSADSGISSSDTAVGTDPVGPLSASGTSPQSIPLTAPSTAGTYYYGACVDSVSGESNTGNNCSSAVTVTVSAAPDLVVGAPSVDDSSPTTGESFTLSATVRNQGDGSSAATTLRYYRSADSTISSSDTAVGTDPVGGLAASGTSAESTSVTAPSTAGTYYYGACVDSVSGESNTGNNCSSGVTVTVAVATAPDLVVGTPSASPSSPTAGESFTLSATVSNQGDGPSAATTLRYYRSTDATISSSDTSAGTDVVGGLSASGTSAESIRLTAPSTAGTYYYGACVDSVSGESNTGNNCSSGVAVAVGTPPAPDLVVGSPSVDDSSPTTGASFTLSATVRNQGSGSSAATTLRYYRSADSGISSSDTAVGTDPVGPLSASGTSPQSIPLTAPSTAGTYYYGACVDSVSGESNTGNNCSSAVTVTVSAAPDLVVGAPSVDDSSPTTGESFTLSATVRNQGDGSSAATTLRYYRSADSTISSSDTAVGTDPVGGLAASGTSAESTSVTAPSTAGTYYYGACVDSVSGESNTGNNCSSGVAVAVGSRPRSGGWLATVDDSSPTTGASFTLSATVRNQGSGSSAATTLRYYRSADWHLVVGYGGGHGPSGRAVGVGDQPSVDPSDRAVHGRDVLLRGLRGLGVRGIQYREQLLQRGDRNRQRRAGPGGWCAIGGRQQPDHRGVVHAERDGAQPGRRFVGRDHPALLPLRRLHHLVVGYGGGHGPSGRAGGVGDQRRVYQCDRAVHGGDLLLRGLRGCGRRNPSRPRSRCPGNRNTGNNCSSAGPSVDRPRRPDLVVGAPVGGDSGDHRGSRSRWTTVRHQGDGSSATCATTAPPRPSRRRIRRWADYDSTISSSGWRRRGPAPSLPV